MTKEEFWILKHSELAMQFNVSVKTIMGLRRFALAEKMTRGQIVLKLKDQINRTRQFTKCPHCHGTGKIFGEPNAKKEHLEQLSLIERANERDWKDITFPYRYEG